MEILGTPLSRLFGLFAVVCLAALLAPQPAAAQVLYGSVVGTVTDQSDAVIPDAVVALTNKQTGQARQAITDAGGRYSLGNVQPGIYDLKVTAKGFRTHAQMDLTVSPDTVGRVDVKLEVGQVNEQVTVEATAAVLQTDKADTHAEIETKTITSLPLSNYRNYQALINLVPGATPAQSRTRSPTRPAALWPRTSMAAMRRPTSPASTAPPASTSGCRTTSAMLRPRRPSRS
jgi:Carboxypeptidase regulatory-like domain